MYINGGATEYIGFIEIKRALTRSVNVKTSEKQTEAERERQSEYTYRAEVEVLPSLQNPDLRREQKRGGGVNF